MRPSNRFVHRSEPHERLPYPGKHKGDRSKQSNPLKSFVILCGQVFRMPRINMNWLLARTEQEGEHLIWRGYIQEHGAPQCRMALAPFKYKTVAVRRLVWANDNPDMELSEDEVVHAKCRRWGCVAPSCLVRTTRSGVMKMTRPTLSDVHRANVAAGMRKKSKVPDSAIEDIRYSGDPTEVLMERHGVPRSYVNQVRRGDIRKEYRANMFTQLIAKENNNAETC